MRGDRQVVSSSKFRILKQKKTPAKCRLNEIYARNNSTAIFNALFFADFFVYFFWALALGLGCVVGIRRQVVSLKPKSIAANNFAIHNERMNGDLKMFTPFIYYVSVQRFGLVQTCDPRSHKTKNSMKKKKRKHLSEWVGTANDISLIKFDMSYIRLSQWDDLTTNILRRVTRVPSRSQQ